MLMWKDFPTIDILNLGSLNFNLCSCIVAFLDLGLLNHYILYCSYAILLLTELFWWVRRWICSFVKIISLSTSRKFISSGCFSVARDMLLSSLILLSDKILSFGIKHFHVIIFSNLSCNDHISSVAFLHFVIWAPLSSEAIITLLRKALTYSRGNYFLFILLCVPGSFPTGTSIVYKLICTALASL